MSQVVIGLDPGLSGAIALLSPEGELERLADLVPMRDKSLSWIDGGYLQSFLIDSCRGRPARAVVERVSSMPGQGVASSFTFGMAFGSVLAVLQARHVSIELVTAAAWKRSLGLSSDKAASLERARLLFPGADLTLKRHHNRAEALLLAHHGMTRRVTA